jgi:hypothetical protein
MMRDLYGKDLRCLSGASVYELSAHGTLYKTHKENARLIGFNFSCSEFLDGWEPGSIYNGIRCENIEELTFGDDMFQLVTSTGVMEHV